LLCRHGAMVLTVCRQVLRDADAAEDAFQATFLVLVRKARSISRREAVGGYLYRVAYRIALRARTQKAKQAAVERPGLDLGGVPLTVGLLAAALSPGPAPAARLAGAAAEAARLFMAGKAAGPGVISARAVLLAEGVLKAMFWTKIKISTALLLAVTAAGLVGL